MFKNFIITITLLLGVPTIKAAAYVQLNLKDGSKIVGEQIESYEDRWFDQLSSVFTPRYILIFTYKNKTPKFYLKNKKDIISSPIIGVGPSVYRQYLYENNITFKNYTVPNGVVLTGNEGHHKYETMLGNFAWDIGMVDENNSQFKNQGAQLEDFYVYDKPVYSPIHGTVKGVSHDIKDNPPDLKWAADLRGKVGNYLTIHVQDQIYISLVHFKKDSITVRVGDTVLPGQVLGTVGNSGVSYIPHLHFTLYLYIPESNRFISIPGI